MPPGLALAACRQGYRVRFYNAAALVNDLLQAEDEHRVPKLLNGALKQQLIVLDELGFIPFSPTGGPSDIPVLLRLVPTRGPDHHHQFALRRLDPNLRR